MGSGLNGSIDEDKAALSVAQSSNDINNIKKHS